MIMTVENAKLAPSAAEREERLQTIRAKIQEAVDDPRRIASAAMRAYFQRLADEAGKPAEP